MQIAIGAVPTTTATSAQPAVLYRVGKLPNIASLVEGAVKTCIIRVGTDIRGRTDAKSIIRVRSGDAILSIWIPRVGLVRRIEIRSLVPFIIGGDVHLSAGIGIDDSSGRTVERVGPRFGASASLAIHHPVGKTRRIEPGNILHRTVGQGRGHAVSVAAGTAASVNTKARHV